MRLRLIPIPGTIVWDELWVLAVRRSCRVRTEINTRLGTSLATHLVVLRPAVRSAVLFCQELLVHVLSFSFAKGLRKEHCSLVACTEKHQVAPPAGPKLRPFSSVYQRTLPNDYVL